MMTRSRRPVVKAALAAIAGIALVVGAFVLFVVPKGSGCTPSVENPQWSVARQWDEVLLDAIRRDIPA
ncbi:MAG: hypothetical protein ABFR53_11080, partial [Actinomycetota bacterium]